MLATLGKSNVSELFETIPKEAAFRGELKVPRALGENELMRHMSELAQKNRASGFLSFLGAGMYAHHIPPAVDQLLLRSEFYTAYTPYQPEVSQGTLQAIWEFQTVVSELFGLPLSNASMYDGASATAEAVLMARRLTKRSKVVLSQCLHPQYRETTETYLGGNAAEDCQPISVAPNGGADLEALQATINDQTAAIVVGYPSFFGTVADLRPLVRKAHEHGAQVIAACAEPYALALVESPGAQGVDIATGEGQPLACAPNFGGPGVGLFACRDRRKIMQQLPGRLCGQTVDSEGQIGYTLTLSTREQHIRRERATSNICTNQGLLALAFLIRCSLLGRRGFQAVARQCLSKTHFLRDHILRLPGYSSTFESPPIFNEFAIRVPGGSAKRLCEALEPAKILPGFDLGRSHAEHADSLLIAVTENHERNDLERLVTALREFRP